MRKPRKLMLLLLTLGAFVPAACGGEVTPTATSTGAAPTAATGGAAPTSASGGATGGQVIVGLITKTDTNPFFVKMKEGAQAEADAKGAKLISAAGKFDGDNESQVTAIENMVNSGVKGILLTPSNTSAIVPAIKK